MSRLGWFVNPRLSQPVRALALGMAVVLGLSACSTSAPETPTLTQGTAIAPTQGTTIAPTQSVTVAPSQSLTGEATLAPTIAPTQNGRQPERGGRLYVLSSSTVVYLDPAWVYSPAAALWDATIMRSLVSYTYSPDAKTAFTLQPDLATDTGTPNADATQWTFNLREGPMWQDDTPVTCDDIKYGISRLFATEVFAGGPTYALQYLDIPTEADGSSAYKGPYEGTGQDLYDRAVVCDANAITFHLNRTVTDFNYATMWGMFPVKQTADKGDLYGQEGSPPPYFLSSGPYQIESYTSGAGGSVILERNPYWDPASDPIRRALPDSWEVDLGINEKMLDQRLMASHGDDAMAVSVSAVQPENLTTIFADPQTPKPDFAGRAFSGPSPFVYYEWINTHKVPLEKQRQAIAVALDREALRTNAGGVFAGELADGVIPPILGDDYAPTGWSVDLFREPIPADGNPDLARRLIEQSGEPMPDLTWDYPQGSTLDRAAAIVKDSLGRAGISVTPNPMPADEWGTAILDDQLANEFGWAPWGYDWPSAATIIPPMFTDLAGWNLSRVDDQDFIDQIHDALTTLDRAEQAAKWQALNKEAMRRAYVIPTMFSMTQALAGTRVGPLYLWAPYDIWPFAEMGVLPE